MPTVRANNLDIFYDEVGDSNAPALLLIMGLGTQMIAWPEAFCGLLADRGFRGIRFDNRDVGLSSKFDGVQAQIDFPSAFARALSGQPVPAPYLLDDMALDALGLLDALGITSAHLVGASMGGMIAQITAAKHRDRSRSLVSIMSSSGDPRLPPGKPNAMAMLTAQRPPRDNRDAAITFGVNVQKALAGPGYPSTEVELRAKVERALDRSNYPAGIARHLIAVLASGSRVELLKTIRVPALVLHGADDPLAPVEGGRDTARHVPGATLKIIPGWGHDLPTVLIPMLAEQIASHCQAADRGRKHQSRECEQR